MKRLWLYFGGKIHSVLAQSVYLLLKLKLKMKIDTIDDLRLRTSNISCDSILWLSGMK